MSSASSGIPSNTAAFVAGVKAAFNSVFAFVVFGTYIGIGALTHDLGLSLGWAFASTLLIWAAPNQVILVTGVGTGAAPLATALAVSLSAVRLLPMVVSLLPLLRRPGLSARSLVLPAHFTAVSSWLVALKVLPAVPRERRVAFCNGIGVGFLTIATSSNAVGFYLAANLPPLAASALLFLTPISFCVSVFGSTPRIVDRLAFTFGLVIGPVLALAGVELDLLWAGVAGGTLAFLAGRLRRKP